MSMIRTTRLTLRPLTAADAPWLQRIANNYDVAKMTMNLPHPYTSDDAHRFIKMISGADQTQQNHVFVVEAEAPMGMIGLDNLQAGTADLGYWLGAPFWGQGYATEAAKAVTRFGFQAIGLETIIAGHFPDNPASGRVLQKTGFHYTGEICRRFSIARKTEVDCPQMQYRHNDWVKSKQDA